MAMVATVIRQLKGSRPVTSIVIVPPTDLSDIDDLEQLLRSAAQDHINEMRGKFVEFKDADFWIDITATKKGV